MKSPRSIASLVLFGALCAFSEDALAIGIERVSSPVFYIDDAHGDQYRGSYVGYRITNDDAVAYSNLWVRLNGIVPGATITLAPNEDGLASTGPLGIGASRVVFFYLVAAAEKPTPETHTVSVFTYRSGSPPLASSTFALTVSSTITASSNKVTSVRYTPTAPVLGGRLQMTITGETGTIGSGRNFAFTPASAIDWPANSYELIGTTLLLGAEPPITDRLHVLTASTANQAYTITYVFRVVCAAEGTQISMLNHIDSGANNKHNDPELLPVAPVPPPTSSPLLLSRTPTTADTPGGPISHTFTVLNTSAQAVAFDDLFDVFSGGTYLPGSTTLDGEPFDDPLIEGSTLHWSSSFPLGPGESLALRFIVTYPALDGLYPHAAHGEVSSAELGLTCGNGTPTQIDTTAALDDDAPARADITVATLHPTDDLVFAAESAPLSILVNDLTSNDGGHAPASFTLLSNTTDEGGRVTYNPIAGLLTYESPPTPTDTFRYRVCSPIDPTLCGTAAVHVDVNRKPMQADVTTYTYVGASFTTLELPVLFTDPDRNSIASARILSAPGGVATITSDTLTFSPILPGSAGTWSVSYEVCDSGLPSACDHATALFVFNDPPLLESFTYETGTHLILPAGGTARLTLADLLISLGVVTADDPRDGDSDGLLTPLVSSSPSGPWSTSATLNDGSICDVLASDLTLIATASPTLLATCYVRLCEELPLSPTVCAIAEVDLLTKECLTTTDCPLFEVCDPDNRCLPCWDSAEYPWLDAGCFPQKPICDDKTCVACQDTSATGLDVGCTLATPICDTSDEPRCVACLTNTDCPGGVCDPNSNTCVKCRDTAPPGGIDAGCTTPLNACEGLSAAARCLDCQSNPDCGEGSVCDIPRRTCVDCLPSPDPSDIDPGCDDLHPECIPDSLTTYRCVECVDDTDCDPTEVCHDERCEPRDLIDAMDDLYVTPVQTALIVPASRGVLSNDRIPPGAIATATLVPGTAPDPVTEGTLVFSPTGAFTFAPFASYVGTLTFQYDLVTLLGGSDRATVRLIVNAPPVAVDDLAETPEDTPVTVAVVHNDRDPNVEDPRPLTLTRILSPPAHGTVDLGTSIVYSPASDFFGEDQLVYEVCDAHLACDAATLTLTITPVNDPPAGFDDRVTTPEDTPVLILALVNDRDPHDPEPDTLRIDHLTAPTMGHAQLLPDSSILYAPFPHRTGTDTFRYTLCDESDACIEIDVRVDLLAINDPPIAHDDTASTAPDLAVSTPVLDNDEDPDDDPLRLSRVLVHPTSGTAAPTPEGTLWYHPAPGFKGLDRAVYEVCDATTCASAAITFFVGADNRPPIAAPDIALTEAGTPIVLDLLKNDRDPELSPLTLRDFSAPLHARLELHADSQTLTYTPDSSFSGLDSFTYTVCDPELACDSARVDLTVQKGDSPPLAFDDVVSTAGPITFSPLDNDLDPDRDPLHLASVGTPRHGTVTRVMDRVTYTPTPGFRGTDTFVVTITDHRHFASSLATVHVLAAPNGAPTARDDRHDVTADTAHVLPVFDNDDDPDLDPLELVSVTLPETGTITATPDALRFVSLPNSAGLDPFTYTIADPYGARSTATVTLVYPTPSLPPVATADTFSTPEDTSLLIAIAVNDYDPKGGGVDVTRLLSQPRHGIATLGNDDTVLYAPTADFSGTDTFTYELCDELLACVIGHVAVLVRPVSDTPIARDDLGTTRDRPLALSVLVNDSDPDGDPLTLTRLVTFPGHGEAELDSDAILYIPDPRFSGLDRLRYEVCDPTDRCAVALVNIQVDQGNLAPLARDDAFHVISERLTRLDVLGNDLDSEGPLTLTDVTPPLHGKAFIDDGQIAYRSESDFQGEDTFAYTTCDAARPPACTSARVVLEVARETPINLAPIATDDLATTVTGIAVAIPVLDNDLDPDDEPLEVWALGTPEHGSVTARGDGVLEYLPAPGFVGEDRFEVIVADPEGGFDASTTLVSVLSRRNLPPIAEDDAFPVMDFLTTRLPVLDNDRDPDMDRLFIVAVTAPQTGHISLGLDGSLLYVHTVNTESYDPTDTFTYTITDGHEFSTATVTLVFPARNRSPIATDDHATLDEDTGLLLFALGNDRDPDGEPLSLVSITPPRFGMATALPGGLIRYVPDPDFDGVETFSYDICDLTGDCAEAVVDLRILPLNDPPEAVDDSLPVGTTTLEVLRNDRDRDGDPLTLTRITFAPRHGSAYLENQTIIYHTDTELPDSLTYEVCDPHEACSRATVTLMDGLSPEVHDDHVVLVPGVTSTLAPLDNDDPGLTLLAVSPTPYARVELTGDRVHLTPYLTTHAPFELACTVCNSAGLCAVSILHIDVTPAPTPPIAIDDLASTLVDTPVDIPVLANDLQPDGQVVTLIDVSQPAHGVVLLEPDGTLRVIPDRGFIGALSFIYRVVRVSPEPDDSDLIAEATVEVRVTPAPNLAPLAEPDTYLAEVGELHLDPLGNDLDPDRDPLRLVSVQLPRHGILNFELSEDTLLYLPTAPHTDPFPYVVTDGFGHDATAIINVLRRPPNRPPVGTDDVIVSDEDLAIDLDVIVNDLDPDHDPLTLRRLVRLPLHGEASTTSVNHIRYTPRPDFHGLDHLAYEVCDPHDACTSLDVAITLRPRPDAPVARDDFATADPNKPILVDVLANDTDVDDEPLTLHRLVLLPAHGTATRTRDQRISYVANFGFAGRDHLVYETCDPTGRCAMASLDIEIGSSRDAPIAQDDSATTIANEPVEVPVLDNDVDPNGDTLRIGLIGAPNHGTLTLSNRALRYTPEPDFIGHDTAFYEACDAALCTAARVFITVMPGPNRPPMALDDVASTPMSTPVVIDVLANDFDPDADALTVLSVSDGHFGRAVIDPNGHIIYTPNSHYLGPDLLSVTITDGLTEASSNVFITVLEAPNSSPVASDDRFDLDPRRLHALPVLDNDLDPDGDPLHIVSITTDFPDHLRLDESGITYLPSPDAPAIERFTYRITDSRGGFDEATVTLVHRNQNLPPIALDEVVRTDEDHPIAIRVLLNDSDPEGRRLTLSTLFSPSHGEVMSLPDGQVLYRPDLDFHGLDTFVYTVCDPANACAMAHVDVTVLPFPDAPQAHDDGVVTPARQALLIDVLENDFDPDREPLVLHQIVLAPRHGLADILLTRAGSILRYDPDEDFASGHDYLVYEACDPTMRCDLAIVTIAVGLDNRAPVPVNDEATVTHGKSIPIDVLDNDTDPDGDRLFLVSVVRPSLGTVVIEDSALVYTANPTSLGLDTFGYSVCDPSGACENAAVRVSVVDGENRPPVATDDFASTEPMTEVRIHVLDNDHDPDGDPLSVLRFEAPAHGTVSIDGGLLTYRPAADFTGAELFELLITDGRGGLDHSIVKILVSRRNRPPTAVDDTFARTPGTMILDVRRNDVDLDQDTLEVVSVTSPAAGETRIVGQAIWFTTEDAITSDHVFRYGVSDGRGGYDEASVHIVAPVVDMRPIATDDVVVLPEDHYALVDVLHNDLDPEGAPLNLMRLVTPPRFGAAVIIGQSLRYTPFPDRFGLDVLAYEVCVRPEHCDEALVRLEVTPTDDPPFAEDDAYALRTDRPYRLPVLLNDVDLDAEGLAFAELFLSRPPEHGNAAVVEDDIVYIADPDHTGRMSLDYRVCDSSDRCDEATVTLLVGVKDQNPMVHPDSFELDAFDPIELDVLSDDLDRDGDILHLHSVGPARHGETSIFDNQVLYVPDPGFRGTDSFPYTACDPAGACASAMVDLSVSIGRGTPIAIDDVATTLRDKPVVVNLLDNDFDPDLEPLAVIDVGRPDHGEARIDRNSRLVYTPDLQYLGTDRVEVRIADPDGHTANSTAVIHVLEAVNAAPLAEDDVYLVPEGLAMKLDVRGNDGDPDAEPTNLVVGISPLHGSLAMTDDDAFEYHPEDGYVGPDLFTYVIVDPQGAFAEATVDLMVGDRDRDTLSDRIEQELGTDPDDADTDDDQLNDNVEIHLLNPYLYDVGFDTDPLDADTDDDGLPDGTEALGLGPCEGLERPSEFEDGLDSTHPLLADTDEDGLDDGLELGLTGAVPGGTSHGGIAFKGTDYEIFRPDADPATTTDPLDDDTDDDGLRDGDEDADRDGDWEAILGGTGTAGSGETDPLAVDTDGDSLSDGLELGLAMPDADNTDPSVFRGDGDPTTTTDPLDLDTDDGSVFDGIEDTDLDGRFEPDRVVSGEPKETDPRWGFDDVEKVVSGGATGCDSGRHDGLAMTFDRLFLVYVLLGVAFMFFWHRRRSR
jgi:hypothetical protein